MTAFSNAPRAKYRVHPPDFCFTLHDMETLTRITHDPNVMGGKPCIRGMRVTVGTIVGLVASGHSQTEILRLYPYLTQEDVREALAYAAWRVEEIELPLSAG